MTTAAVFFLQINVLIHCCQTTTAEGREQQTAVDDIRPKLLDD